MTDPLSIAGSIAGLVSISDVVFSKIYRYAKAVKDARKDIMAFADETRSLSGVLHNLSLIAAELDKEPTETMLQLDHIGKFPLFIDRLYSDRPGALFVERDCPPTSQDVFEKTSAFSALTAMLTSTIGSMQPAKVVQFFCGRHTSSSDPLGGPNGLIRGILAQLLQQDNFSLSFIDSRTLKEYIERHSLAQLTDTLKRLVHQLDRRVILFIFVDGVSLFERSEWIQDLNKVMYDLGELTWNKTVAATVKLIVTNPGKSRSLGSCVALEDRVLVPFLPDIRGGKLTDRMVNKELNTSRGDPAVRQKPEAFDDMDSEGEFDLDWLSAKGEV